MTNPITASAKLASKGRIIQANLAADAKVLALQYGQRVLPFKIGINGDFLAIAKEGRRTRLREAIRLYVCRTAYLRAMAAEGSMRHDINGEPAEAVADDHRLCARQILEWRASFWADPKAWAAASGLSKPREMAAIMKLSAFEVHEALFPRKKAA